MAKIGNQKDKRLLYHITPLDNLESIIKYGILPRAQLHKEDLTFTDIANQDIVEKRTAIDLDEYVPFHFCPYTPFDYAVQMGHPDTVFIYLCIRRTYAEDHNFLIVPRHPLSESPKTYPYKEGIDQIDWETMANQEKYSSKDAEGREIVMAECLSPEPVPVQDLFAIYFPTEEGLEVGYEVVRLFNDSGIPNEDIKNLNVEGNHDYMFIHRGNKN